MITDPVVLRKSTVKKVLEVAQQCVAEKRKGWFVQMPLFWAALDDCGYTGKEVREALGFLQQRTYFIVFLDEDGHAARISLVPQRFRCWHCNMLLDMQDDFVDHIGLCLKRQAKIARNRKLL